MNDLVERLIDFDLLCVACEYNLRTQPVTGRCPECQTAVADSLRRGRLRFADPRWVARVRRGIGMMLVAAVGMTGLIVTILPPRGLLKDIAGVLGLFVVVVLGIAGVVLTTARQPGARIERWLSVRSAARVLNCGSAGVLAPAVCLLVAAQNLQGNPAIIFSIVMAVATGAAGRVLLVIRLRRLARRGPEKGLAQLMSMWLWAVVLEFVLVGSTLSLLAASGMRVVARTAELPSEFLFCMSPVNFVLGIVAAVWLRGMLSREMAQRPAWLDEIMPTEPGGDGPRGLSGA